MFQSQPEFDKRLAALDRKHMAMTHGYKTVMRGDGLIIVKPKSRVRWGLPFKLLFVIAVGFFAFKGLMLAALGETTYNDRVTKLSEGSSVERGGAWMMQIDPASQFFSGYIAPYVR